MENRLFPMSKALGARTLTPEERAFCDEWFDAHAKATSRTIGGFGLVMSVVAFVALAFLAGPAKVFLLRGAAIAVFMMLGWAISFHKGWTFGSRVFIVLAQLAFMSSFSFALHLGLTGQGARVTLAAALVLTLSSAFVRLCPFYQPRILVGVTVIFAGVGAAPYFGHPDALQWTLANMLAASFAWGCEFFRLQRMRNEALHELDARARVRAGERMAMEKELELARQIQDSYTLPPTQIASRGLRVNTFQKKHHVLGGDWVGVRELADGRIALIVSDASGKGVQAALVTHALQSLWANAMLEPDFEPVAWLERVNKTLLILGKSQLQTMTIGVVVISATEIVYYSAGHVPCFVAVRSESGRYVKALRSRGNMVGVVENLDLEPAALDLSRYLEVNVLLGSDGVFFNAHSTRSPAILSMIDKLERGDADAVMAVDSGDDKLLIWVQVQTEAGAAPQAADAALSSAG